MQLYCQATRLYQPHLFSHWLWIIMDNKRYFHELTEEEKALKRIHTFRNLTGKCGTQQWYFSKFSLVFGTFGNCCISLNGSFTVKICQIIHCHFSWAQISVIVMTIYVWSWTFLASVSRNQLWTLSLIVTNISAPRIYAVEHVRFTIYSTTQP